jgi:hypothetical protein
MKNAPWEERAQQQPALQLVSPILAHATCSPNSSDCNRCGQLLDRADLRELFAGVRS